MSHTENRMSAFHFAPQVSSSSRALDYQNKPKRKGRLFCFGSVLPQTPADTVRDALRALRAVETQPAQAWNATKSIDSPALIVADLACRTGMRGSPTNATRIEGHMLGTGLALYNSANVSARESRALDDLIEEIEKQNNRLHRVTARYLADGGLDALWLKGDVVKANGRIQQRVKTLRQATVNQDCQKNFALSCIENALRSKAWAHGTYRDAQWHPLDDVVHAKEQAWMLKGTKSKSLRAQDLGAAQSRFVLHTFQQALDAPGAPP